MGGLLHVSGPEIEPVSTVDAKAHLGISGSDHDAAVAAMVAAARSAVETFLKMALLPTIYDYRIDWCFLPEIRLPIGPLRTLDGFAVSYVDDQGVTQTLDASSYRVSLGETGLVRPAYGYTWPSVLPVSDAVSVRFTAGYPTEEDIPRAIRAAILTRLSELWGQSDAGRAIRKEVVQGLGSFEYALSESRGELSQTAKNLLMPFVRWA